MDLTSYFKPLEISAEFAERTLSEHFQTLSNSSDASEFDLAILFVPEYRYNGFSPTQMKVTEVVEKLGGLHLQEGSPRILMMGEFICGQSLEDTEAALIDIFGHLINNKCLPIVIGGTKDLVYSGYKAFANEDSIVNITALDTTLNLEGARGYIGRIIKEQPNFLFNYSNLAYQSYYVSQEEIRLAEELFFDAERLGNIRNAVERTEPAIRGSEIVTLSLESIKSSDFKSVLSPQPNGLYSEEICQISRYAGLSEKCKCFYLTEWNGSGDHEDQMLMAQLLWCFIDGWVSRRPEMPGSNKSDFLKYRVALKGDEHELIFYKSLNTDRWWMEVPVPPQYVNRYKKHHIIPCDYSDYEVAAADDLPERWWKTYKKML